MQSISKDDILNAIGLEVRRDAWDYFWPSLGLFGAGILMGVGFGMLYAPKAGHELRDDIGNRFNRETSRMGTGRGMGEMKEPPSFAS